MEALEGLALSGVATLLDPNHVAVESPRIRGAIVV